MPTPTLVGSVTSATSSSTSYSCNKPTGVAAGDLLLSLQWSAGTIGAVPSGWTQLETQTSGATSRVAYLAAGGSEPGNYTVTQTAQPGGTIIIAVADASLAAPVSNSSSIAVGSAVSTPSVTPAGLEDFEVRFAVALNAGQSFEPASGFTEQVDVADTGEGGAMCATRVLASGAATGTHTFGTSGTPSAPHGYTIAITEAPSGRPRIVAATFTAVHRAASW
ncbi:hypothetical protein AB0F88_40235 [Streptosporangium sp. NPDC023963]|uniref:hypothetical protein n=1 Tax=Streptosporangium sp. NPDC023963 TaxID=3155608 RepID=UPI00341205A5